MVTPHHAVLRSEFQVSRPTVQAYMRAMGIAALLQVRIQVNLPRASDLPVSVAEHSADHPNHIWGIDITYIRLPGGWLYLVAVLDWYSRRILSWALSQTLELDFVLTAVDQALCKLYLKSGTATRAATYQSPIYRALQNAGVKISMMDADERDNIFTERLWRTIKYEEVYLHEYAARRRLIVSYSIHPIL